MPSSANDVAPSVGSYTPDLSTAAAAPAARVAGTPQLTSAQPGSMIELITVLAERADPLVKLVTATVEKYQKGEERKTGFQIHMAWVAVLVVLTIIGVSTFLTYVGKIDGSTFTFLLGLIVGYVLTFIRDSIKSPSS